MYYQIGYSKDQDIRYQASSGGIGTAIIKYLMESGKYGTSMTFVFNVEECRYELKLIYDFSDYNNCGSIYQDIDNINFIKRNLCNIRNGIIVTCMPCQVNAIKTILKKNKINCFVISLFCSGQTTVEGTWQYYKLLGINKKDVHKIQYRGKGWPSGIQISLKNGNVIKRDNHTYPWTLMHHSLLFRPRRCFYCKILYEPNSDVTLADAWLEEYLEKDKIGNTIIISNDNGYSVLNEMSEHGSVFLKDVREEDFLLSQSYTINCKKEIDKYKSFFKIIEKMKREGSLYKYLATSSAFMLKMHMKLIGKLRKRIQDYNIR